jgi:hypothetical protein
MTYPTFASGDVLLASDMNAVGLWLVKTQVIGSAVASVAVKSCFSSTYDNYLVTLEGGTVSADAAIGLQLGASTTGYYGILIYGSSAATTVNGANVNNSSLFNFVGGASSGQNAHVIVDLLGPNKAAYTKCYRAGYQNGTNYGHFAGQHQVATAYTGFTLIPSAGTLTGGTIRVYGYRN